MASCLRARFDPATSLTPLASAALWLLYGGTDKALTLPALANNPAAQNSLRTVVRRVATLASPQDEADTLVRAVRSLCGCFNLTERARMAAVTAKASPQDREALAQCTADMARGVDDPSDMITLTELLMQQPRQTWPRWVEAAGSLRQAQLGSALLAEGLSGLLKYATLETCEEASRGFIVAARRALETAARQSLNRGYPAEVYSVYTPTGSVRQPH